MKELGRSDGAASRSEDRVALAEDVGGEGKATADTPDHVAGCSVERDDGRVPAGDEQEATGAPQPKAPGTGRPIPPAHLTRAEIDRGDGVFTFRERKQSGQAFDVHERANGAAIGPWDDVR